MSVGGATLGNMEWGLGLLVVDREVGSCHLTLVAGESTLEALALY